MARAIAEPTKLEEHPAYAEVVRLRVRVQSHQELRRGLKDAIDEQRQLPDEITRLETAALEVEGGFLLGDSTKADVDRVKSQLEQAQERLRRANERFAALEKEIARTDDQAELQRFERAQEELRKIARQYHAEIVREMAQALRQLATAGEKEKQLVGALESIDFRVGFIRIMRFPREGMGREDDPNSSLATWLREARDRGEYGI